MADAGTPKPLGLKELHDTVREIEPESSLVGKKINALVQDLEESRLFTAPDHDVVELQAGIRRRITDLGAVELDETTSKLLLRLEELIAVRIADLDQRTAAVPVAESAAVDEVAAKRAANQATGPAEMTTPIVAANDNATAPEATQTTEATATTTDGGTKAAEAIKSSPVEQLMKDLLKAGKLKDLITNTIRGKLVTMDDSQLEELRRLTGRSTVGLSERAKALVEKYANAQPGEIDKAVTAEKAKKEAADDAVHQAEEAVTDAQSAVENMRSTGSKAAGKDAMASITAGLEKAQQKLTDARAELHTKKKAALEIDRAIQALQESKTHRVSNAKFSPKELLMLVNHVQDKDKAMEEIAMETDEEISALKVGRTPELSKDVAGIFRPTLTGTLEGLGKIKQLSKVGDRLKELAKLKGNVQGLETWVDELDGGEKNYLTTVPTLLAYLQASLADAKGKGNINRISAEHCKELIRNLQRVRNSHFEKEATGADGRERMLDYFKRLAKADENEVKVDASILDEMVAGSYTGILSKAALVGVGGVLLFPVLGPAAALIGAGKVAALAGYGAARYGASKLHSPAKRALAESAATRVAGMLLLPGIGFFAPELLRGTRFLWKHKTQVAAGAATAGAVAVTTGRAAKAVALAPVKAVGAVKKAFKGGGGGHAEKLAA